MGALATIGKKKSLDHAEFQSGQQAVSQMRSAFSGWLFSEHLPFGLHRALK